MLELKVFDSILQLNKEQWDNCFLNALEDYNYLLALEEANNDGFKHIYYAAFENGKIVACFPAFIMFYSLKTTVAGLLKKLLPGWLGLKMLCISSCFSENGLLGFLPSLSVARKQQILTLLIKFVKADAKQRKINFVSARDITEADYHDLKNSFEGFTSIVSLPSAMLSIEWGNFDEYLSKACSANVRSNLRRKLKNKPIVTIEKSHNIDAVADKLVALYEDTESRSDWHFGKLNKGNFTLPLKYSKKAFCNIYYIDNTPMAFSLMFENGHTLYWKYYGMDYNAGKNYNLYFICWAHNVEYAIQNNIKVYQAGQTGYFNKMRWGCKLDKRYNFFWHRTLVINWILKKISKVLAFNVEEELAKERGKRAKAQ